MSFIEPCHSWSLNILGVIRPTDLYYLRGPIVPNTDTPGNTHHAHRLSIRLEWKTLLVYRLYQKDVEVSN